MRLCIHYKLHELYCSRLKICKKNATWRWHRAHPQISTHDKHRQTEGPQWVQGFLKTHVGIVWNFCHRQTDRQTDRRKATHMSPPCNLHRWAQKRNWWERTEIYHVNAKNPEVTFLSDDNIILAANLSTNRSDNKHCQNTMFKHVYHSE